MTVTKIFFSDPAEASRVSDLLNKENKLPLLSPIQLDKTISLLGMDYCWKFIGWSGNLPIFQGVLRDSPFYGVKCLVDRQGAMVESS